MLSMLIGCGDAVLSAPDATLLDAEIIDGMVQDRAVADLQVDLAVGDTARDAQGGSDAMFDMQVGMDAMPDMQVGMDATPDMTAPSTHCAPLAASAGTEMRIGPNRAGELPQLVRNAPSGTVILLEDGVYRMSGDEGNRRLQFATNNVTMRSVSNDASAVVIDGEYQTNEMVFITADDVTIAHVTLTHAVDHAVHVSGGSGGNTERTLLYGLRLIDNGEQFVKVNPSSGGTFADNGKVECSEFEMTDAGRPNIESNPGGCYTGGIDTHSGLGWEIRDNRFEGIYCTNGSLAEHAVHFWSASRDTIVERNTILNCARGVGFGLVENGRTRDYADNPYPGVSTYIGHFDGIIRGNVIIATVPWFDTGVELAQARGAKVYHNTVVTGGNANPFSSIDYRFASTQVDIRNNIVGNITQRNGASAQLESNLSGAGFDLLTDPVNADAHLKPSATDAIDKGVPLPEAGLDIDLEGRDNGQPDIGADEFR